MTQLERSATDVSIQTTRYYQTALVRNIHTETTKFAHDIAISLIMLRALVKDAGMFILPLYRNRKK